MPPETIEQLPKEVRERLFPNYPDEHQITQFFNTLGRALSVWQLVEIALQEVYRQIVAPNFPAAAGAGFNALQAFNVKLSMVDAGVRVRLVDHATVLPTWEALKRSADRKARRRNQFVHFVTYIMFDEPNPHDRIRLEPHVEDYRYGGPMGASPKLRMTEIADITTGFSKLAVDFQKFAAQRARLPASP